MTDRLHISLNSTGSQATDEFGIKIKPKQPMSVQIGGVSPGSNDYNSLRNKPSINGVELAGALTSQSLYIVSENTTAGWAENPTYIPKKGEIVLYTDYAHDESGNPIPAIKTGDGAAYVADLPFVGDDVRLDLLAHINDPAPHVTDAERAFWNNKLNYDVEGEELFFNRN